MLMINVKGVFYGCVRPETRRRNTLLVIQVILCCFFPPLKRLADKFSVRFWKFTHALKKNGEPKVVPK